MDVLVNFFEISVNHFRLYSVIAQFKLFTDAAESPVNDRIVFRLCLALPHMIISWLKQHVRMLLALVLNNPCFVFDFSDHHYIADNKKILLDAATSYACSGTLLLWNFDSPTNNPSSFSTKREKLVGPDSCWLSHYLQCKRLVAVNSK